MDDDVGPEARERVVDELARRRSCPRRPSRPSCSAQVVAPAGGEVVDDEHLVAAGEQAVGEVRADEAGAAGDQDLHASTSSGRAFAELAPRGRGTPLPELEARAAPRSCGRSAAPGRAARARPAVVDELPAARRLASRRLSTTNSRTAPARPSHSCSGTGKPILSGARDRRRGSERREAPSCSTCFRWPSLNLTSAGIVAASSTSGWSSSGTRDSSPCAMLTRSSTCSSAGSSVLKSKWVICRSTPPCRTLSPWKISWNVSNGE